MKSIKFFQDLADRIVSAYPVEYELEIRDNEDIGEDQGEFYIETWEGADEGEVVPEDKMVICLSKFEDLTRDQLIDLLRLQVFIHEMAHALQFRGTEYEEVRDIDHDAEWGVKVASVYEFLMENGIEELSEEDRDAILGLTKESKELIISNLAAAISRDMETYPND